LTLVAAKIGVLEGALLAATQTGYSSICTHHFPVLADEYLGQLSANPYQADSTSNPYRSDEDD